MRAKVWKISPLLIDMTFPMADVPNGRCCCIQIAALTDAHLSKRPSDLKQNGTQ